MFIDMQFVPEGIKTVFSVSTYSVESCKDKNSMRGLSKLLTVSVRIYAFVFNVNNQPLLSGASRWADTPSAVGSAVDPDQWC